MVEVCCARAHTWSSNPRRLFVCVKEKFLTYIKILIQPTYKRYMILLPKEFERKKKKMRHMIPFYGGWTLFYGLPATVLWLLKHYILHSELMSKSMCKCRVKRFIATMHACIMWDSTEIINLMKLIWTLNIFFLTDHLKHTTSCDSSMV